MTLKGICSLFVCASSLICLVSASALASTVHVEGSASFELRYTLAPRVIVVGEPIAQPKPYWVVVVKGTDGNTYELDQEFDLGIDSKPAKITLLGKTIQENFGLSLDGEIAYQSDHYVWISTVSNVEPFNIDYHQIILPPQESDPFTNWTCEGQLDASNEVYADVWFQSNPHPSPSAPGSYIVRLSSAPLQGDNRQFSELAYLDGGHISVEDRGTVFAASTTQDSISLEIDNSEALVQVPGVITFSIQESARDLGVSSEKSVSNLNVLCNRNR